MIKQDEFANCLVNLEYLIAKSDNHLLKIQKDLESLAGENWDLRKEIRDLRKKYNIEVLKIKENNLDNIDLSLLEKKILTFVRKSQKNSEIISEKQIVNELKRNGFPRRETIEALRNLLNHNRLQRPSIGFYKENL